MKKTKILLASVAIAFLMSCKDKANEDTNVVEDGAAKSGATETGQHVGSTTDSTTTQSDEPNPSNY